jgi:peptidoglycan/xylan/chitin deacetylase (PgdA/CDA1 family)
MKTLKGGIRRLKRWFAPRALILVYHRISDAALDPWSLSVRPDHFAEHLSVLQRSFHPTSLQTLSQSLREGRRVKPKSVVITFDDGYADNLHNAAPLLERFDCPATVFIVSGALGSPREFWWDELASLILLPHPLPERLELSIRGEAYSWQLGQAAEYRQTDYSQYVNWRASRPAPSFRQDLYLQLWQLLQPLSRDVQSEVMNQLRTWAGNPSQPLTHRLLEEKECIELARSQMIEIGAHTIHHPSLAALPCEAQKNEISGSKRELERLINRPVPSFSYPFGKRQDYSPDTVALVQASGFSAACINESGVVNSRTDIFQLPRFYISDCNGKQFEERLLFKLYA